MRVVLIGGTGHIGTYLAPGLVADGHEVIVLSRGQRVPYLSSGPWREIEIRTIDREAEDIAGSFGNSVAALKPEVVIDLICFNESSARQLSQALEGEVQQLLHCGTIWVHGPSAAVPTLEDATRRPFGEYGIAKAAIEEYLLATSSQNGPPATVIHPGHISGPGWAPVNPIGNGNVQIFQRLADGQELAMPNLGLETLQHVHASDVAGVFRAAIVHRSVAVGESFHAVSAGALTLRGYAECVAQHFGQEARLTFLPWDKWRQTISEADAEMTWDHISHSPNCSMEKAAKVLNFRPSFSALDTVLEAVDWLVSDGQIRR